MSEYPTSVPAPTSLKVSEAVDEITRSRMYERVAVLDDLKSDLGVIGTLDKRAEKNQLLAIVLCFVTIIAFLLFCSFFSGLFLLGFIVFGIAIILLLLKTVGKFSIPDERYLVARRLVEMFARDTADNAMYSLMLDFDGIDVKRNFLRPALGGNLYGSKWLVISGRFFDDTEFEFKLTELLKVKYRKGKRRPKGYKLDLLLTLNDKRYAAAKDLIGEPDKVIKLPAGCVLKTLQMRRKHFRICVRVPSTYDSTNQLVDKLYAAATSMFLSSYYVLNLSRRLSRLETRGDQP